MGEEVSLYTWSSEERPEAHKKGLSENWGQESDTTENKLQIHSNLERKTNDKQKSIFTE